MWRFVQLSDPHLGSTLDGEWNNRFLCSMMPEVIRCLRRDLAGVNPEFLLVTGDLASDQTRDAVFAARDLLDSLKVPYYPCRGNHDSMCERSRQWFHDAFQGRLPGGDSVYSFTYRNLHFSVLEPWWKWRDGSLAPHMEPGQAVPSAGCLANGQWALPPHQFAWLEDDLSLHRGLPTFIAVHYPVIPIPGRRRRPGLRDAGCLENGDLLLELLERHPQAKGVLAGHVHLHFVERRDTLVHVVTGALPEFPTEYREFQVYDDRIEVHTRGLSDTRFAARSLLPGGDWAAGAPEDRGIVIPLEPGEPPEPEVTPSTTR